MEEELRLLRSSTGPGKNIPGPVDDQRSEKDRPPQSVHSIVATKKEPEQKPKNLSLIHISEPTRRRGLSDCGVGV